MLDRRDTEEAGFTLIEVVVAMAMSIVVILALTVIMEQVLGDTSTTVARLASTRLTRLALTNLENELHSACVGTGSTQNLAPIQPASDGSTLIFVSYTGSTINPTPTWHSVAYNSVAATLTDTSYAVTGSNGNWSPTGTGSARTLLRHVSPINGNPVFQYYAYKSYPGPDSSDYYWTIPDGTDALPNGTIPTAAALSTPLTSGAAGTAAQAVEVLISLQGGPDGAISARALASGVAAPETDAISLRLTTPPNQAPLTDSGSFGPCE